MAESVVKLQNISKMGSHGEAFEQLEPVPVKYAYYGILSSILFFQLANWIVTNNGAPKSVDSDFWRWKNLLISWVHAVIVSIWDIAIFAIWPELFQDLIAYHNIYIYGMVCFSVGYFVYDIFDMYIEPTQGLVQNKELIAHHLAVISTFSYNLVLSRCLAFNCIALWAEINSVFLHARKLMQLSHFPPTNIVVRVNKWLNVSTFAFGRFGCLVYIFYGMYHMAHRVDALYYWLLAASMFVMTGVNIVLFYRLIRSDFIKQKKYSPKNKDVNGNNNLKEDAENHNLQEDGTLLNGIVRNGVVQNGVVQNGAVKNGVIQNGVRNSVIHSKVE